MLEIFLVRHGETEWNAEHRVQGWRGSPLTPRGRAQAAAAGRALAAGNVEAVYTSPLERAVETARIVAGALGLPEPAVIDELREIGLGPWEGMLFDEVKRRWPAEHRAWREDARRPPFEGMETAVALEARARAALEFLVAKHASGAIAAVLHGGVGSAILDVVLGIEVRSAWHLLMNNGGISSIHSDDGRLSLRTYNVVSHLEGRR